MPAPDVHDAPRGRCGSAHWFLASPVLLLGLVPGLDGIALALAATAAPGTSSAAPSRLWHGFTPRSLLSARHAGGFGRAVRVHARTLWRTRLATARFGRRGSVRRRRSRSWTRLSRRIAPALQSASLRSYVLRCIVDRRRSGGERCADWLASLPAPRRWTSRSSSTRASSPLLIIAGAMSAAFARSTMAAVLSLGAVGYGVALMFALLGAPDLAMTQFAVETLTVVIFVLVFSHFRGFGDLSSRLVRSRDALVAVGIGTWSSTLVLVHRRDRTRRRG